MTLTKRQVEILDAALTLTAAGGIGRLTIKNLAAAMGFTEPAIYRHFAGKSAIVQALIGRFDEGLEADGPETGWAAIRKFVEGRIEQVLAQPALSKVLFAEELFMGDADAEQLLMTLMHKHRNLLAGHFAEAIAAGEIRSGIAVDTLFRLVFGPVRLLVRQWGMSNQAFPLRAKCGEMLDVLGEMLQPR